MTGSILIAWRGYVAPLATLRAPRVALPAGLVLLAGVAACSFTGLIPPEDLRAVQRFVLLPGIPVLAALFGEMALRDGITQRTLLYPLLGPVPRATLATVRTAATAALLAAGLIALLLILKLICGGPWDRLAEELLAVVLAAWSYTALMGIVHLLTPRGLIVSLALFAVFDYPLGRLPIGLRVLAPSHHVRTLADIPDPLPIPISIPVAAADPLGSALALAATAALATVAVAVLFANKRLAEVC